MSSQPPQHSSSHPCFVSTPTLSYSNSGSTCYAAVMASAKNLLKVGSLVQLLVLEGVEEDVILERMMVPH